jgi:hypothetical protein
MKPSNNQQFILHTRKGNIHKIWVITPINEEESLLSVYVRDGVDGEERRLHDNEVYLNGAVKLLLKAERI